jgi:hypothetical protein
MKFTNLPLAMGFAVLAGACTSGNQGSGPYYGPSQGYAYPPSHGYYSPPPNYYHPTGAGYGPRYAGYNSGPSITFTLPHGMVP